MHGTADAETRNGALPGPVPTSLEHAERCRACGKCGTIIWPPDGDALAGATGNRIN